MKTNGIKCYSPIWSKGLVIVVAVLIGYFLNYRVLDNSILGWICLSLFLMRIPFYSPDMIVYDEGIETNRFGFKHFLKWSDIEHIRVGTINCLLRPRNIPSFVKMMFYDSILINGWHTNFSEVREKLKENQGAAGAMLPQRAYD